jgi:hypothetical protein
MPLVTIAQIKTLLDVDVEQRHILEAEADVDRVAGIDLDDADAVGRLRPRDLKLLKWAITYQAAWLSTQIDRHARLDVIEISGATSDGGIKTRDELTLTLAPLCRSNLERISWKTKSSKRLPSTRARAERFGLLTTASNVTINHDPVDTYAQLGNAMTDQGPWAEAPDRQACS